MAIGNRDDDAQACADVDDTDYGVVGGSLRERWRRYEKAEDEWKQGASRHDLSPRLMLQDWDISVHDAIEVGGRCRLRFR
jgi:hypothetical protein